MTISQRFGISLFIAMLSFGVVLTFVSAQTLDTQVQGTVTSETSVEADDSLIVENESEVSVGAEAETSEDVSSKEKVVPGAFGLFMQGLKERVSLLLTLDPVKEAEKRLEFAQKRLELAETFSQKAEESNQSEKVERMMLRAYALVQPVASFDANLDMSDEQIKKMIQGVADHQLKRQEVMSRIEANLSPEQVDALADVHEKGRQNVEAMLRVLENDNLPGEVRAHLIDVRARIEAHTQRMAEFKEKREELRERLQAGDETAKQEIKKLQERIRTEIKERRNERQKQNDGKEEESIESESEGSSSAQAEVRIRERVRERIDARKDELRERTRIDVETKSENSNVESGDTQEEARTRDRARVEVEADLDKKVEVSL